MVIGTTLEKARASDGSPILPEQLSDLYGTVDGMAIYDNGLDVCSWEYAARHGYARPLWPVYQDLSDLLDEIARE